MQPKPASRLVRYRAEILPAPFVNAIKDGLASSSSLSDKDVAATHRVWIPLPIISFSLSKFVKPCDMQSCSVVIDLTDDPVVIDLTDN
jgi:hypothetical protein